MGIAETYSSSDIGSGHDEFDNDLAELLNLGESAAIKQLVSETIDAKEANTAIITRKIPLPAIRAAAFLSNPKLEELKEQLHPDCYAAIEEAMPNAEAIKPLLEYEPIAKLLTLNRKSTRNLSSNDLSSSMKLIDNIQSQSQWFILKDFMVPAVRLALRNEERGQLYLDTTADWNDLLFLTRGFLNVLSEDIQLAQRFADADLLGFKLNERYPDFKAALDEIEKTVSDIRSACKDL